MSVSPRKILNNPYMSYAEFKSEFAYQGESLYAVIFERHKDKIKINKEKFAARNLKKIFDATFIMTPKIGFQAMSLRDLSTATELSMGGLYSSISSKENIAIIVKDMVALVCEEVVEESRSCKDPIAALHALIRGYLYASTLMQPWFYFLYFETRSLPESDQEDSKNIELTQVEELNKLITILAPQSNACHKSDFVATMALSLIQERYLKPWKYKNAEDTIDDYADKCLQLIYRAICVEEREPCKNRLS